MKLCLDFATNCREELRVSFFQSNLQNKLENLSKNLKSVKIIQYYSILFIRVLDDLARLEVREHLGRVDVRQVLGVLRVEDRAPPVGALDLPGLQIRI